MVEVRFVGIPSVVGVKCTLDGVVKYTAGIGIVSFYGISQGEHTYSVEPPAGMVFVSGEDTFHRPLGESGTTIIEFYPAGLPWPEDLPWALAFTFEAENTPSPGEFRFDSWNPPLDAREIFIVGAAWPAVVRTIDAGEDVYAHYVVKNVGAEAGEAIITVKDLDTGSVITTWSIPELAPNERFKTSSPGAYIGKMPDRAWRLEFKVEP